jgi:hypothetical protein
MIYKIKGFHDCLMFMAIMKSFNQGLENLI